MVQASDRLAEGNLAAEHPPPSPPSTTTHGDLSTTQLLDREPSEVASTEVRPTSKGQNEHQTAGLHETIHVALRCCLQKMGSRAALVLKAADTLGGKSRRSHEFVEYLCPLSSQVATEAGTTANAEPKAATEADTAETDDAEYTCSTTMV